MKFPINEREILRDAGKVSKAVADVIEIQEYESFNQQRITQHSRRLTSEQFIENNDLKEIILYSNHFERKLSRKIRLGFHLTVNGDSVLMIFIQLKNVR
ncbi:MAG: hypothetical protein U5K84_13250 [Alkalibacterium sp.]|nr:hypothetical protein [Alkalibacterium sp.]